MDHPREARAAALGGLILIVYIALVLASGGVDGPDFLGLLSTYLRGALMLWLLCCLVATMAVIVHNRPREGTAPSPIVVMARLAADRWQADRMVSLVWPPLLFALLMASFNAFKQLVLIEAGFGLDPLFASIDRALFFGRDGWEVTHALLPSPWATWIIDKAYHAWFIPMSIGVIVCALLPASHYRLRTQYLLTYLLIWVVMGSVLAFAMASAGPIFFEQFHGSSPSFGALHAHLVSQQAATGGEFQALLSQSYLSQNHGSDALALGGGISAMPSVHNALAALFAIAAFRINRIAGWAFAGFAAVIWIGSIHLGWHYAIDGMLSIPLTLLLWRWSGRIADRLAREPASAPTAAPALA